MSKNLYVVVFALALLVAFFAGGVIAQVAPFDDGTGNLGGTNVIRGKIRSSTHLIHWRNAANPDTSVRMFTGATLVSDTSREVIYIGGANTICVVDSYGVSEDSAMVKVFVEFSNDKVAWFRYLAGNGLSGLETIGSNVTESNAAIDSSGNFDTAFGGTAVHAVSISSPPTYANWLRVLASKRLSAATDTMRLRTSVAVHTGDE